MGSNNYNVRIPVQLSILITILGTALFTLTDGTNNPLFPFAAELMLTTQLLPFLVALPLVRIPIKGLSAMGLLMWIFLLTLSMVSVLWGDFPFLSLQRTLLVFVPSIFLFLLTVSDKNPIETFWKVARGLIIFGVLLSMIGIVLYIFGTTIIITEFGRMQVIKIGGLQLQQSLVGIPPLLRISSLAGNPNSLASWLMITLNLTVAQWLANRLSRFKFILLFGVQVIALLLTFSRAGIGTTIITMGLLYVLSARKRSRQLRRTAVLFLLLFVSIFILSYLVELSPALQNRLKVGLNERGAAWYLAWNEFIQRPLTGVGFGISYEAILEDAGLAITMHNLFLGLLSELGIIGFMLVLNIWLLGFIGSYYMVKNAKKIYNNTRYDKTVVCGFIISVLTGLVVYQFFEFGLLRYGFSTLYWAYLVGISLNPVFTTMKYGAKQV